MSDKEILKIDDPTTGLTHHFSGATEAEAERQADKFFGIDEADASS
ncbi:hypothetical protein [Mycobacteroides abscessus]|nr:hypothetical protein [Mycobacteroides abscessus]